VFNNKLLLLNTRITTTRANPARTKMLGSVNKIML